MPRFKRLFKTPNEYIALRCGHRTQGNGMMNIGGKEVYIRLELTEIGRPEWCLHCIACMARTCANCGNIIIPYSFVALQKVETPKKSDLCIPNGECMTCLECSDSKHFNIRFVPGTDGVGILKNMQNVL